MFFIGVNTMKLIVSEDNTRLDKYIALNTSFSRSLVEKMLDNGFILVNDEVKKGSYKLAINDEIYSDESFSIDTDIKTVNQILEFVLKI